MLKKNSRGGNKAPEVNASSMADIAFLLLIFFLVTTTILEDKGVLVLLPPWSPDEEPNDLKLKSRNVYNVLVNANNQLLVEGELADVDDLREKTKEFIANPQRSEDLAESPRNAIISLQHDRGTEYGSYLEVYDEIKAAYRELRDEAGEKKFGRKYEFLADWQRDTIKSMIPLVISEADPTEFGDEQ